MNPTLKAPHGLMINLLRAPHCLRRGPLSFSYRLHVDTETPIRQAAYRLAVAEGIDNARAGRFFYDTGRCVSADSTGIMPADLPAALTPGRLYYAQVAVFDDTGRESPFSNPTPFTVDTDWASVEGIWTLAEPGQNVPDFAFLRHVFSLTDAELAAVDRAYLSVTATSPEPARQYVYNVYMNDTAVGVGPCRLGKAPDGTVTLPYAVYDVTDRLHAGENALAAICYTTAEHAFLCQLTVYDREGSPRILTNSGRDRAVWHTLNGDEAYGKDHSIGTSYYKAHACNINGPLYPDGFASPAFTPDDRWMPPVCRGDIRASRPLLPDETEPLCRQPLIGVCPTVTATITEPGDAYTAHIDLGTEIVGGLCLELQNPTDTPVRITLDYAEQRVPDGQGGHTVKSPMNTGNCYRETWTLKPGRHTYGTLSMMTYRYVRITGLPALLTASDVHGTALHKPFDEDDGALHTDNPLLSDLYRLMKDTVRYTSQDIYVDSQSRERGAYEGDLLINMLAAYAVEAAYAPARLSTEYLLGHRTWPADYLLCIIFAARADYMATGDSRLLSAWYDTLKANLFTAFYDENVGLIHSPAVGNSNRNAVLVDWPPSERDGYDMAVPYSTVFNALCVRAYRDMAEIADVVGKPADAASFRSLGDRLRSDMTARLYDPAKGRFRDGLLADGTPSPHMAQHATAYALYAGLYTDRTMARRMAESMTEDGKLHVSVYAAFFLLEGLYRAGCGDIANRLLFDTDASDGARTWAYMLYRMHATLTTEAWNETNKPNMTLSHPWGAAPAHMIVSGICGITPTSPGFASVDIRPTWDGIGDLDVQIPTIRGPIHWVRKASEDSLAITLPPNMTATLFLPDRPPVSIASCGTFRFILPHGSSARHSDDR